MAKSTRKSARAATSETRAASGDRLHSAVWHNGRMYDPDKPGDQAAFKKLVQEDKAKGEKDKQGNPVAKLDLQRLADEGAVSGYGTKAKAKRGKKSADDESFEESDTGAAVGGGVDAVEEGEATDLEE